MLIFLKALAERQKTIFIWYLKEREAMKTINKENDVLIMDELLIMKELL